MVNPNRPGLVHSDHTSEPYISGSSAALFTDMYQLTMAQAYVAEGMSQPATFSLFYRNLPDAPDLDIAYKLVEYAGEGRMKLSSGKPTLPGAKQIFRRYDGDKAIGDTLGRRDEALEGSPLLEPFVIDGRRRREADDPDRARERAGRQACGRG